MQFNSSLEPVLVTGAAGFVGSYLCRYLHRHGVSVRAMVRDKSKAVDLISVGIEVVEADLMDPASLEAAVQGCGSIMHIAAIFRQAGLPDETYRQANVEGTRHLLEFAVRHNVKRFIHCSTVGVHSHISNPPGNEETPYAPADIYQVTKMEGEKLALEYFRSGKLSGVVIRPAMIYGPGDMRTLKIFKSISKNRFFFVGKGEVNVHFIDVRDLVRAFALALDRTDVNAEVFIISGKESVSLKDFVQKISAIIGTSMPRLHLPVLPLQLLGDVCEAVCTPLKINPPIYRRRVDFFTKNRHFDSSKAERILNFKPSLSLDQELREIVDWYAMQGYLHMPFCGYQLAKQESFIPKDFLPGHPFCNTRDLTQSTLEKFIGVQRESNSKPTSVLLRYVDGTINFWDPGSQNMYGWNSYEAEGRISHHILQTTFPSSLEKINQELLNEKAWNGRLIHTSRSGEKIEVFSNWQVIQISNAKNKHLVIETNTSQAA